MQLRMIITIPKTSAVSCDPFLQASHFPFDGVLVTSAGLYAHLGSNMGILAWFALLSSVSQIRGALLSAVCREPKIGEVACLAYPALRPHMMSAKTVNIYLLMYLSLYC